MARSLTRSSSSSLRWPWLLPRLRRRVALWPWYGRWLAWVSASGAVLILLALLALDFVYGWMAGKYDLADLGRMPERTIVYDGQGGELGRLHGENRVVIKLKDVAPFFVEALLAREDNAFYEHGGIAWKGVLRAMFRRMTDGATQGASTLTMQLARNSYGLTRDPSLHRKLLEIAITRRIESSYSKDEILEFYLNRIFFGTGMWGLERAAQGYFGKSARELSKDECAMLAAIIRGPNKFSPFRHYDIALSGRDMVLDRMVAASRLSATDADEIKRVKTKVLPAPAAGRDSWAMESVRRDLEITLDGQDIEEGGLKVYTTLDSALQAAAERTLRTELERIERLPGYAHQTRRQFETRLKSDPDAVPDYLQGAAVVIDNATGATLAMAGGRDVEHSTWNRAVLARRQAGSTFKPFVYAAACERGMLPGSLLDDGPLRPGDIRSADDPGFRPDNSDGSFTGRQRADWGLSRSRNTMAVRAGEFAGMDAVLDLAGRAGFGELEGRSAQLYLGNAGVTLEALTSAYTTFANAGSRCRPYLIDRIEDAEGHIVFRSGVMEYEAMKPGAAWLVARMLEKVCQPGGTAAEVSRARLAGPVAGKTGTTDDYRDAWFAGFNPRVTCGVWIGLDDPERIVHRGYGSRLALPVWIGIMRRAELSGYRGGEWKHPPVRDVDICRDSGCVAGVHCPGRVRERLPADSIPPGDCPVHRGPNVATPEKRPGFLRRLRGLLE